MAEMKMLNIRTTDNMQVENVHNSFHISTPSAFIHAVTSTNRTFTNTISIPNNASISPNMKYSNIFNTTTASSQSSRPAACPSRLSPKALLKKVNAIQGPTVDGLMMLATLASSAKPLPFEQHDTNDHDITTTPNKSSAPQNRSNSSRPGSLKKTLERHSSFSNLIAAAVMAAEPSQTEYTSQVLEFSNTASSSSETSISYYQADLSPSIFDYMKVLDKMHPLPPLVLLNPSSKYQETDFHTNPMAITQY